jgi:branched-chain amino acid transport system ATP-binding protein
MTLEVRDLRKYFGGVHAVDGVSFEVSPGECVALIGPNGAGKSTSFGCLAGQHKPTSGEVLWEGRSIDGLAPAQRLHRGVARTFQVAQTFEALTALKNLQLLLVRRLSGRDVLADQARDEAIGLLARVGLQDQHGVEAQDLPYGARKRLELALALASRPRLLLLDEPAAGLAEDERGELMVLIKSLAAQGMAVLYAEHNMDAVFGVADRVLVLIDGRIAAQGTAQQVAADPVVRSRYLGESFSLESDHA